MSPAGRIGLVAFVALVGFSVRPHAVAAQGGNFGVTVTPTAAAFPTPTSMDFDGGYVDAAPLDVDVTSRPRQRTWDLYIRSTDPDMGGYGKPVSDILWRLDGMSTWVALDAIDQVVVSGQGDQTVRVHFRVRLDWASDVPGDYFTGLTFTAVRQ